MENDLASYLKKLKVSENCYRAPAKINLFLEILGKREDGYHEIETWMHAIDLSDELRFEWDTGEKGVSFSCSESGLPVDENNLVVRATRLLIPFCQEQFSGVKIHLEKKIPYGAGLGGGSSDAATTLMVLNHHLKLGFSREQLSVFAAELGSDVAFFLYGGTAIASGRGEKIQPLVIEDGLYFVLTALKDLHIPTVKVYKNLTPFLTLPPKTVTISYGTHSLLNLLKKDLFLYNKLELSVFSLYPDLESLKKVLVSKYSPHSLLSGSGAFFFTVHTSLGEQEEQYQSLRNDLSLKVIKACSDLR